MREVVIVDGARSAFTKLGGGLKHLPATDIGAFVIRGLLEKTKILERGKVDDLMAGNALGDSQSGGPARYMVLASGLPQEVSACFVETQCGSAITALNHAAWKIGLGLSDVAIVGGMESYSNLTAKFSMSTEPYKLIPPLPMRMRLAPTEEGDIDMISVSDLMAKTWDISREDCDVFAAESQQRLKSAYDRGITGPEIIPYTIPATRKTPEVVIDRDEQPRFDTTYEGLAKLRSVKPDGVTTAGNASGRNDGAAFLLIMSADKAKAYGYEPLARWVTGADIGCPPELMGIGAAHASLKAMKQAGLGLGDIDVFECNEAFAAQNLAVIREMEIKSGAAVDRAKWNPNGGAIAIGHPNGASGGRVAMFAMRQLEQTGGRYGVISSCCGGGLGTCTVIENLRL